MAGGGLVAEVDTPLLRVEGLSRHYISAAGLFTRSGREVIRAVDDVSFSIESGQTLGLVGESGCGKSTLARTLLRLDVPTDGQVLYRGQDVYSLDGPALKEFRRRVQVVFQDPYASLNPRMTVAEIINEAWEIHPDVVVESERHRRCHELLELVGLRPEHASRHPHQFSGGQRQRIGIARALALEPELIVLDEPVSALDMSVQAQVVNLLASLRREFGLSYLFIAHDLAVIRHISQQVAVMYLGSIVEHGDTEIVFQNPSHPYTRALLAASPLPDPELQKNRARIRLQGDPPDPSNVPTGCRFRTRCWKARTKCAQHVPTLEYYQKRRAACFFPE